MMLGRIASLFVVCFVALYVAIAVLLPTPASTESRVGFGGEEAAARLSQQAQSLVSHRPSALQ